MNIFEKILVERYKTWIYHLSDGDIMELESYMKIKIRLDYLFGVRLVYE